jgi:hypothetical protein
MQNKYLINSSCSSTSYAFENETTFHQAQSHDFAEYAILGGHTALPYIENNLDTFQVIFRSTETSTVFGLVGRSVEPSYEVPYLPLTAPVPSQHDIDYVGLDRNIRAQYHLRQDSTHSIKYGTAIVDISTQAGLDAELPREYDGLAPVQGLAVPATSYLTEYSTIELYPYPCFENPPLNPSTISVPIHEYNFEFINKGHTYQPTKHTNVHPHPNSIQEYNASYAMGESEVHVELVPTNWEVAQGLTAWGNDLAGVGAQFMEGI